MTTAAMAGQVALPRALHGRVTAVCVTEGGRHRVAWFDGLHKEIPDGPTFAKPKPAIALADYLNGVTPDPAARDAAWLGASDLPGSDGLQARRHREPLAKDTGGSPPTPAGAIPPGPGRSKPPT